MTDSCSSTDHQATAAAVRMLTVANGPTARVDFLVQGLNLWV